MWKTVIKIITIGEKNKVLLSTFLNAQNWLYSVIDLPFLLLKSVFGHGSLLPFSQNRCTKSCPIWGDNSAQKALWKLGSCSLRMPWLPHDAHKRILAISTKVAPRLSPQKVVS